jgi:hypothetical protein
MTIEKTIYTFLFFFNIQILIYPFGIFKLFLVFDIQPVPVRYRTTYCACLEQVPKDFYQFFSVFLCAVKFGVSQENVLYCCN